MSDEESQQGQDQNQAQEPPGKAIEPHVQDSVAIPVGNLADLPQQAPPATPSAMARWLAFGAILIGGACGGLIGWGFVDLQCDDCSTGVALGGLAGALLGAGGLAIVAVLGLRAMAEWQSVQDAEAAHKHPSRVQDTPVQDS